ncbi:MAG: hypothetical protein ACI9YL_001836 [Luteibaculaceae bacterium]|jgi:hypothetical protein
MMRKKHLQLPIIAICITMFSCSQGDSFILNETFDKNTRGWIEESSEHHGILIDGGKYLIESKDTSSGIYRSSAGSLDKSYLFALPDKYDIESKFLLLNHDLDDAFYGLLLRGAMCEYSFNFYDSGVVEVLEYNSNSHTEYILFSDTSDYKFENDIQVKISVDNGYFSLFIEDFEIGHSEFNVKSWRDLRLFTSKQSKISVDYLTIKKTKQNE